LSVPGVGRALGSPAHSETTSCPAARRVAIWSVMRITSNAGTAERFDACMSLGPPCIVMLCCLRNSSCWVAA
jgi:hypothetical protein